MFEEFNVNSGEVMGHRPVQPKSLKACWVELLHSSLGWIHKKKQPAGNASPNRQHHTHLSLLSGMVRNTFPSLLSADNTILHVNIIQPCVYLCNSQVLYLWCTLMCSGFYLKCIYCTPGIIFVVVNRDLIQVLQCGMYFLQRMLLLLPENVSSLWLREADTN